MTIFCLMTICCRKQSPLKLDIVCPSVTTTILSSCLTPVWMLISNLTLLHCKWSKQTICCTMLANHFMMEPCTISSWPSWQQAGTFEGVVFKLKGTAVCVQSIDNLHMNGFLVTKCQMNFKHLSFRVSGADEETILENNRFRFPVVVDDCFSLLPPRPPAQ